MAEVGPPEKDEKALEGDELDIYLFSNGQQYSPPRKYHLRADELTYWAATLAFLGRSQYGALCSSIQLYELDGRKVEGAKDIRDCAVYVAVVPPDPFISAGYDKYLVKASRSYERRFSKKGEFGPSNQDTMNNPAQNQNPTSVKGNKISPQCEPIQKNNNVCNCKQKISDTIIKPVANQLIQGLSRKLKPSDVTATKIQSLKKDTPKYNSNPRTNRTTPGIPVRSLNSDRNKCAVRAKSPAKTLSFDTSIQKRNDTNQKFVYHKPSPNTILKNKLSFNQVSPSLKTLKLNNFKAPKTDVTMDGESMVGDTHKSGNHSHVTINEQIYKSLNELSEPPLETKTSTYRADYRPFSSLLVDDQLPTTDRSRGPCVNIIKTPLTDTQLGLFVHEVPIVNEGTASAVEEFIAPNSSVTNLVNNKTNISHTVRNINENFHISAVSESVKSTYSDSISTISENKLADSKRITSDRLDFTVIEKPAMLTENNMQQENIFEDQNNAAKATNFNDYPKLTPRELQLFRSNQINLCKEDDELKTNLDFISILNETRTSTGPHSFILKSEEKPVLNNKERIVLINKRNEIVNSDHTLKTYETDKPTEADPIINIKLSTAEATSRSSYFETVAVDTDSSYKMNRSLQCSSEKEINEINETIFHHLSDKIFQPVSKVPLNVNQNNTLPLTEVMPNASTDIVIKTEDLDPTKIHSFIFYITKHYDYKSRHEDIEAKTESEIQGPVSSIIKNKDMVHINIFRSSIDKPILKSTDAHRIQNKILNVEDFTENFIINDQVSNDKELSKPVSDEKSTDVAIRNHSKNLNVVKSDSDDGKFIALVQNGDTINLKLSIQFKNADGKFKSTETNALPKSSSASRLRNNKLHKTPNQLTGSKSLQSVINQCPPHLCCRRERIEVNQCPCCNYKTDVSDNQNLAVNPLNPSLQGLYVLLPISTLRESVKSPNQTIDKEVQYTESLINYCFVQIVEQEVHCSQLAMESSQTPPSQMESKTQQTTRHFHDQSVQTDWCDVLLEAKVDSDGNYTFYLPPLSLLQEYELR